MTTTKRQTSPQAAVAKTIRQAIKADGYRCTATSDSFSMGNSVDVTVYDMDPDTLAAYEKQFEPHEYGTFDGMTDCQGIKNGDFKGPQTKFLSFKIVYSPELKQAAWNAICEKVGKTCDGDKPTPELYQDADSVQIWGEWGATVVYQYLRARSDSSNYLGAEFWSAHGDKPSQKFKVRNRNNTLSIVPTTESQDVHIEEHTHTKKGHQMFIVVLPDRVPRPEYIRLEMETKLLGGHYSRPWKGTPGGFAFLSMDAAQQFVADQLSQGES